MNSSQTLPPSFLHLIDPATVSAPYRLRRTVRVVHDSLRTSLNSLRRVDRPLPLAPGPHLDRPNYRWGVGMAWLRKTKHGREWLLLPIAPDEIAFRHELAYQELAQSLVTYALALRWRAKANPFFVHGYVVDRFFTLSPAALDMTYITFLGETRVTQLVVEAMRQTEDDRPIEVRGLLAAHAIVTRMMVALGEVELAVSSVQTAGKNDDNEDSTSQPTTV